MNAEEFLRNKYPIINKKEQVEDIVTAMEEYAELKLGNLLTENDELRQVLITAIDEQIQIYKWATFFMSYACKMLNFKLSHYPFYNRSYQYQNNLYL
jgi:hypothetical protein